MPRKLIMQNMKPYRGLIDTHHDGENEVDESIKAQREVFKEQVISDAEKSRIAWQVGKAGQFGDDIEPLDETFLQEILTGEKPAILDLDIQAASLTHNPKPAVELKQFSSLVNPDFILKMESVVTLTDVCKIMNLPQSAMTAFASALNPAFNLEEDLGINFKRVVVSLLRDRKEREKQLPTRTLFGMKKKALGIENSGFVEK
jgi:hypothetical protein